MIEVSDKFTKELEKTGITSDTFARIYLEKEEERVEITDYLIENGLGVVTKEIEKKELNRFICGDVALTCVNTIGYSDKIKGDGEIKTIEIKEAKQPLSWVGRVQAEYETRKQSDEFFFNSGSGFFDTLDERIRCEIYVGFKNCDDEILKFDGFIIPKSVKRLGMNKLEFVCHSWEKELEEYDAQEIADLTNPPIKKITGITLSSNILGGKKGVYKLKYNINSDGKGVLIYDDGDEVILTLGNRSYKIYNKYAEGDNRRQGIQITTALDLNDLPDESQEDTIVIKFDASGILKPCYWYENIHLEDIVKKCFDKADITTQDIKVKEMETTTGKKDFSYYNAETKLQDVGDCIYNKDPSQNYDLFIYTYGDRLMKVERRESETLLYRYVLSSVDSGAIYYKLWYYNKYIFALMKKSGTYYLKTFTINKDNDTFHKSYTMTNLQNYRWIVLNPQLESALIYLHWVALDGIYCHQFDMKTLSPKPIKKVANLKGTSSIATNSCMTCDGIWIYFWYSFFQKLNYLMRCKRVFLSAEILLQKNGGEKIKTYSNTALEDKPMSFSWGTSMGEPVGKYIYVTLPSLASYEKQAPDDLRGDYFVWNELNKKIIRMPDETKEAPLFLMQPDNIDTRPKVYGWDDTGTKLVYFYNTDLKVLQDGFLYTPKSNPTILNDTRGFLFGIVHLGASNFIGWEYSNRVLPYLIIADFKGLNLRQALDNLAKNFLCIHYRQSKTSARFYYRDFYLDNFTMGKDKYQENSCQMKQWEHQYNDVKITGRNSKSWEAGQFDFNSKVLDITCKFLDGTQGQVVADWFLTYFEVQRQIFKPSGIFLPHLELMDKITFTDEYEGIENNLLVYKSEYLHNERICRLELLEYFDDNALLSELNAKINLSFNEIMYKE